MSSALAMRGAADMTGAAQTTLASILGDRVPDAYKALSISGLCLDSRKICFGDAFVALHGEAHNGLDYVREAKSAGAVAVFADTDNLRIAEQCDLPLVAVPQLEDRLPGIAARFYDHPARALHIVGITGTNGKTSCAWLYANWRARLQTSCGVIGTLGCGIATSAATEFDETGLTTPDAIALQRCLAKLRDEGCEQVAMEVSSHALAQDRVAGVNFESAIFTNLSRDHLDYHHDMQSYADTKRRLFEVAGLQRAAINVDDPAGRDLLTKLPRSLRVISYALEDQNADVHVRDIHCSIDGIQATVVTPQGDGELHCPLPGKFNLANLLAVLAVLLDEGLALPALLDSAMSLPAVPGRMQRVALLDKKAATPAFAVFIDYAHTPDALQNALLAIKPHAEGALRVVFGAGGDRDIGKRALMGAVAARLADQVILTNDNPRSELPEKIVADIRAGMPPAAPVVVELDRAAAIALAVDAANAGDVVLVAGKGHELFQQEGDRRRPFSDYAIAQAALQARCAA
ncbi:MAG: UDP-N-acetylmuramoyl-L-alanyl-D-glutamate--2,6-diaminopimelate ligase [Pseudomonadales bacterium]